MDADLLERLAGAWRDLPCPEARDRLLLAVAPVLPDWPHRHFGRQDRELVGDFVLEALRAVDRCLVIYDPSKGRFAGLLTSALRRAFLKARGRRLVRPADLSLDALETDPEGPGRALAVHWDAASPGPEVEPLRPLLVARSEAARRAASALRLWHAESMTAGDWRELTERAGRTAAEGEAFAREIDVVLETYRVRRRALEGVLARHWTRLLHWQARLTAPDPVLRERAAARVARLEALRARALDRYRSLRARPPAVRIAAFMRIRPAALYEAVAALKKRKDEGDAPYDRSSGPNAAGSTRDPR